jgi:hypothetical protein
MEQTAPVRLQADISLSCKARLNFYATLNQVPAGQIVEQALNEFFTKEEELAKPKEAV